MKITRLSADDIDNQITRLKEVQEETFSWTEAAALVKQEPANDVYIEEGAQTQPDVLPDLPEDDPYMMQADNLQVGIWVEFSGDEDHISVR